MIRRSTGLLAFLIALLSLPAAAYTGGGNATVMSLGSPSGNCVTWPNSCPTVLNSAAAPLYTLDPTVNASIQSLLTALQAPLTFNLPSGASTSALQSTGNGYLLTLSTFTTSASTSALQSTGNGFLSTLATASASQATAANQTTANGSLASIAANTALRSGTMNRTSVTCGTGTTTLLAASSATQFVAIKVPASATVPVWVDYTGVPAVTASPSEDIGAGQKATWTNGPNGFLPTAQINCIASSATTVTVEYK